LLAFFARGFKASLYTRKKNQFKSHNPKEQISAVIATHHPVLSAASLPVDQQKKTPIQIKTQ
jgi:hypothetical protein